MKKSISLLLAVVICLSLVSVPAQAAGNVKVDFYCKLANKTITQNINWDAAYFKQDASTYNYNLAIASLVLANAAYDESKVMDTLLTFGFSNFEGKYNHEWNDWDRVAYTFAYDSKNNVIAIAIRGTPPMSTGDLTEWVSNIVNGEKGFTNAAGRAMSSESNGITLVKYLQKLRDYGYRTDTSKYWIVGHSRGAAVANIMGKDLVDMGTPKKDVYVYGFATPNYANKNHIPNSSYTNIFNICFEEDGVTHNPTKVGKFGIVKNRSVNSSGLYSNFKSLTDKDIEPIMSKLGVLSMTGSEAKLYILSDKGKYAHAPETYLALLLSDKSEPEPSGDGPGGGGFRGEDVSITTINKNMTVDVGAGFTLRFCSAVSTSDSAKIGTIPNGATVYVYGNTKQAYENRIWAKIRYNNQDGWVNSQYLKNEDSTTTAPSTPSVSVTNTTEGNFIVTIPANTTIYGYSSATSTSKVLLYSPRSASFKLSCTKRLTMSDGTTRYFFRSGGSTAKDYYLLFTSSMSVSGEATTPATTTTPSVSTLPKPVVSVNGSNVSVSWPAIANSNQLDLYLLLVDEDSVNGTILRRESAKSITSYTFRDLTDGNYSVFLTTNLNSSGISGEKTKFSVDAPSKTWTVTIQYDAMGGSGAPSKHYSTMGSDGQVTFTISSTIPKRSGYTFTGWKMQSNGGGWLYSPGESVSFNMGSGYQNNVTVDFYAQWEESTASTPTQKVEVPANYRPKLSGAGSSSNTATLTLLLTYDPSYPITELGYVVTDETGATIYYSLSFTTIPSSGEHQYKIADVPNGKYCPKGYVIIDGKRYESYPLTLTVFDP